MGQATPTSAPGGERSGGRAAVVLLISLIVVCIAAAVTVGLLVLRPRLSDLRAADAEQVAARETAARAEDEAASKAREVREMRFRWQAGAAEAAAAAFVSAHICEVATDDLASTLAALDALADRVDPTLAEQAEWQEALTSPEVANAHQGCGSGGAA